MDDGRWTMDDGRWTMDDGRWTMDDGRWTMDDGRWTMDDGRWTMDDGRWTMDDGRWTMDDGRSIIRDHFFRAPGGTAEKRAALRGADEFHQILDFGAGERFVLFDLFERPAGVQLRLEEVAVGASELADHLFGEAAADEADGVQPVNTRAITNRLRVRQSIFGHDRVAAHERMLPDAAELMHPRPGADRGEVFDIDMATERGIV